MRDQRRVENPVATRVERLERPRRNQTRCPKCGHWGCPTQRTMTERGITVQYRKCGGCGHNFKRYG